MQNTIKRPLCGWIYMEGGRHVNDGKWNSTPIKIIFIREIGVHRLNLILNTRT